jgi:tetratricopeptide (TPR) repeat protein
MMPRPFVGRVPELDVLGDRFRLAASGRGTIVLVAGPAGIGKSALVEEGIRRDGQQLARVVRGFCLDDAGAPPLWPWQRALHLLGAADLIDGQETPNDPAHLASARFRRLARAAELVVANAAQNPTLIVLEDLHWADSSSVDLLRHIAELVEQTSLMVIATHREPLPERLAGPIAGLARYGVRTLRLSPFTPAEVAQYVGTQGDPMEVHSRTAGLPLLVATVGVGGADLPSVVTGLLSNFSETELELIKIAALLGEEVDAELIAQVSRRPADTVAAALRKAAHTGIVTGTPRFAHALVQQAVADLCDPSLARDIHQRAAHALAVHGEPARAGQVAAHWRRAGERPEALRAHAHWSRLAARHARENLALDDSARHLLDAVSSLSRLDDEELGEALLELATAEFVAGRYDESITHCARTAEVGRRRGQRDLVVRAALTVRGVNYPHVTAVIGALCRTALSYLDLDDATRARLLAQVAIQAADKGSVQEAESAALAALELATASGDPRAELDAVRARESSLLGPDAAPERLRLGDRAVALAQTIGEPVTVVIGHEWRIKAGYHLARMDLVDEALLSIAGFAETSNLPLVKWHLLRATVSRAVLEGNFDLARRLNHEAATIALTSGDVVALGMSYVSGQHLCLTRGDIGELLANHLEQLDLAPPMPLIRTSRAMVLLALGRRDEARAIYEEVRLLVSAPVIDMRWGGVLVHLVELAEEFGDAATCELLISQLEPYARFPGAIGTATAYFIGSAERDLGRLNAVCGRLPQAEHHLRQAVENNIALRARPHVVLARLDLAKVLVRQGKDATDLLKEASAEARRLDMPGALAIAVKLKAQLTANDPLSPREREVATLMMKACTNPCVPHERGRLGGTWT